MLARFVNVLRRRPWTAGAGVVLVLALAGTAVTKWVALQRVTGNLEDRREAVVNDAFATIEEAFGTLQGRVRTRAKHLATDSVVANGLKAWADREERPPALVQRVLDASLDDRTTVEETDIEELEAEIDRVVYDLFDLTQDEREVVEDYLDVF